MACWDRRSRGKDRRRHRPFGGWQILCRLNHDDGWDHRACMDRRAIRTETKARECVEWQYSMPMLGKLCATPRPVAVLNLFEQSDGAPKGAVHTQQSVNVCRKWARCKFLPGGARDGHKVSRPWIAERDATEFRRATRVAALSRQARGRSGGARRKWVLPRRGHGRSSASWGFSWSIFGPE